MPVDFYFRPRFCDFSMIAPRDFVFMVLIALRFCFSVLVCVLPLCTSFYCCFRLLFMRCTVISDGFVSDDSVFALELSFVFSGFEETGFLDFLSTSCVHVCVLWIPTRMACLG